jgi:hypothetical protein
MVWNAVRDIQFYRQRRRTASLRDQMAQSFEGERIAVPPHAQQTRVPGSENTPVRCLLVGEYSSNWF